MDDELALQIELLMNPHNDPMQNMISHLFDQPQSSNDNTLNNINNNLNVASMNNQSVNSTRAINVPLNTVVNNSSTSIPTTSLPPIPHFPPPNNINLNPPMAIMPPQMSIMQPQMPIMPPDPRNYMNPNHVVNPLDPNWEAISAFLQGQVRIGADVERVFKCGVCNVEFANAQALGGHMSSHTKNKKAKEALGSKSTKNFKAKKAGRR